MKWEEGEQLKYAFRWPTRKNKFKSAHESNMQEIETLRKENSEMYAELNELKKKLTRSHYEPRKYLIFLYICFYSNRRTTEYYDCDACKRKMITNEIRFHCKVCPDFDLCEFCAAKGKHCF